MNQRTYESLAAPLAAAGEQVSWIVGQLLKAYWQQLIDDPTNIRDQEYVQAVGRAAKEWQKEAQDWIQAEIPWAYLQGLELTDKELEALSKATGMKMRAPVRQISPDAPLLPSVPLSDVLQYALPKIFDSLPDHRTFVGVFQRAAHYHLEGVDLQILRAAQDLARNAAIQAGDYQFSEGDIFTRVKYAQQLLNEFAKRGLQAIEYRDGRKVSIDTYSEMVGRSLTGRCAMQASLNRYQEYGYDLVRVSAHFRACPLCVPWEGRVLSHSGASQKYPSLQEATEAGLFHHNCAHDINPYIPGLSPTLEVRMSPEERALVDEYGYHEAQEMVFLAQERQRQIERNIRAWKRREAVSIDPDERAAAHRKVLDWQAAQRDHLDSNPYLPRKYSREQIRGAH